jgi:hypothetical protein
MTKQYILIDPEAITAGRADYFISKEFDLTSVDSEVKVYATKEDAMEQINYYRDEYEMDIELCERLVH